VDQKNHRGPARRLPSSVLSADWTIDLPAYYDALPESVAVQGNLDPLILSASPDVVRTETTRLLESMRNRHGHILNVESFTSTSPEGKVKYHDAFHATSND